MRIEGPIPNLALSLFRQCWANKMSLIIGDGKASELGAGHAVNMSL